MKRLDTGTEKRKTAEVQPTLFEPPRGDCPNCQGTGSKTDPETQMKRACPNCGGSGSPRIPY